MSSSGVQQDLSTNYATRVTSRLRNCWACVSDYFNRALEASVDFTLDCYDWCSENLCWWCCGNSDRLAQQSKKSTSSDTSIAATTPVQEKHTPPQPVHDHTQVKSSATAPVATSSKSTIAASTSQPIQDIKQATIPVPVQQQQQQQQQPSNHPAQQQHTSAHQNHTPAYEQLGADKELRRAEPPKMDFHPTGSIFGDRKRSFHDQTMLRLENGRFKSPGMSNVVHTPGGRPIRVSFMRGFPANQSLESHRSVGSYRSHVVARKSLESPGQQDSDATKQKAPVIHKTGSHKSNE